MTETRKFRIHLLILLMLILPLFPPLLNSIRKGNDDFLFDDEQNKINIPKSSSFWAMGPLHIKDTGGGDYTWAEAVLQDWCSGGGTLNNPYLLENITVDAGGNEYAILIENSNNKYFTIRNCTVLNSGSAIDDAGIKLISTSNGTIEENICLNNTRNGILLYTNCIYNTIQNNTITEGSHSGIALNTDCDFNKIVDNIISNITDGISIWVSSNINITGNHITTDLENHGDGIYIREGNQIFISNNVVALNSECLGIFLSFCNESTVINNHIFNTMQGIYHRGWNNYIASNLLENNTGGLTAQQSYNSTFFNNTIVENEYGIYVDSGSNTFYMNYVDNNVRSVIEETTEQNYWSYNSTGNYWSDYSGVDLNDDGIGDTPYLIDSYNNSQDDYPIWDDGESIFPTIIRNSPSPPFMFGASAPVFNLSIFDLYLHMAWYKLNNTYTHFFTPVNGINIILIDQDSWDAIGEGNLSIEFFVNDTNNNLVNISLAAFIDLPPEDPPEDPPSTPGIPYGHFYLIFLGIGILALLIVQIKRMKRFK